MGFLDNARAKLTDAVDKHGDKIAQGIDKAAKAADDRTGGKHAGKIASGAERAKEALDRLDKRDDDLPGARDAHDLRDPQAGEPRAGQPRTDGPRTDGPRTDGHRQAGGTP